MKPWLLAILIVFTSTAWAKHEYPQFDLISGDELIIELNDLAALQEGYTKDVNEACRISVSTSNSSEIKTLNIAYLVRQEYRDVLVVSIPKEVQFQKITEDKNTILIHELRAPNQSSQISLRIQYLPRNNLLIAAKNYTQDEETSCIISF